MVFLVFPDDASLSFDQSKELVFKESCVFAIKGESYVFPVLIVVNKFVRFQHFEMNKTYNEPNI